LQVLPFGEDLGGATFKKIPMKKLFFIALIMSVLVTSCKDEELIIDETPIVATTTETTLLSGTFKDQIHPTSGTAKVIEDKDKKRFLVLENLKSDSGPDLRIYLSADNGIKNATEITSKIVIGNSKFEIPSTVDLKTQNNVIIWCKQFSVLFGNAPLK
jgi:Electron transfer DM13